MELSQINSRNFGGSIATTTTTPRLVSSLPLPPLLPRARVWPLCALNHTTHEVVEALVALVVLPNSRGNCAWAGKETALMRWWGGEEDRGGAPASTFPFKHSRSSNTRTHTQKGRK